MAYLPQFDYMFAPEVPADFFSHPAVTNNKLTSNSYILNINEYNVNQFDFMN